MGSIIWLNDLKKCPEQLWGHDPIPQFGYMGQYNMSDRYTISTFLLAICFILLTVLQFYYFKIFLFTYKILGKGMIHSCSVYHFESNAEFKIIFLKTFNYAQKYQEAVCFWTEQVGGPALLYSQNWFLMSEFHSVKLICHLNQIYGRFIFQQLLGDGLWAQRWFII